MPDRRDGAVLALALGLLTVLAQPASAGVQEQEQAQALLLQAELARADSLLAGGGFDQAAPRLEQLLEKFGDDPVYGWQLQERLGVVRLRMGDAAGALEVLEASARSERSRPSIHRNLAAALMALGRRGRALSEYRQALELAPRDCDIRLEFGQVLLEFRNTAEAAVHLERANELCGRRPDVLLAIARLRLAQRRYDEAAELLGELYSQRPDPGLLQNWQAALLGAGRDRDLCALLRSLPESGLDGQQLQILLEAEGRLGNPQFAREQVDRLDDKSRPALPSRLHLPPHEEARFWGTAALNLLAAGDAKAALRASGRAIELEPENVIYRNNRVVALTRLGRDAEARSEWERVLELDPSLADAGGNKQEDKSE